MMLTDLLPGVGVLLLIYGIVRLTRTPDPTDYVDRDAKAIRAIEKRIVNSNPRST